MATITVNDLTLGEALLIARRRSGESQEAVARRLDTTRNAYGRLERDEEDVIKVPPPELDELTDAERCLILRRRSGLTQEDCAEEIGVTRYWFNQMETDKVSVAELVKFWEQRDAR